MKLLNYVRNACLAAATIREHLGDDPAILGLQLSRRLPEALIRPLTAAAANAHGRLLPAMAAVVDGRKADAEKLLASALESDAHGRSMIRLADVATAAALPDLAEKLLDTVPETRRGWAAAQARLAWYQIGRAHV